MENGEENPTKEHTEEKGEKTTSEADIQHKEDEKAKIFWNRWVPNKS